MSKRKGNLAYLVQEKTQNVYDIDTSACVGRNPGAAICNSTICNTNRYVSRNHLVINYHPDSDTWTITDVSVAGTVLNNIKLVKDEPMQINHGDVIWLASTAGIDDLIYTFKIGRFCSQSKKQRGSSEINRCDKNVNENMSDNQLPTSKIVPKMDENKNKIKNVENQFVDDVKRLSDKFESQTQHMCSQSDEFKALEKNYKETISKLQAQKESEIEALRLRNEELLTRLHMEEEMNIELREKILQIKEIGEKVQKENEELHRQKNELLKKIQENEQKELEKAEELNSLKEDLKLAVAKKRESENVKLSETLESVANRIETELLCSVCSDMIIDAMVLNCGHIFCKVCITQWLKKKAECSVCPMCRVPVVSLKKCSVLNSLLDSVSEELPSLKKKRQELMDERSGTSKSSGQSASTSKQAEGSVDIFSFPASLMPPAAGNAQIRVTGPVDHIDLTLDDSVLVIDPLRAVGPAPEGIDLTSTIQEPAQQRQQQQHGTLTRNRRSTARNRWVRLRGNRSNAQ